MKSLALGLAILLLSLSQDVLAAQAQMKKPTVPQGETAECIQYHLACTAAKTGQNYKNCVTDCEKAKIACKTKQAIKGQLEAGKAETPFNLAVTYSLHCRKKLKEINDEIKKK